MDKETSDALRDHAWKHFALHADQRLKAFNFFLILATVIVGGLFTVLKDTQHPALGIPLALMLSVLSFIFWKLDVRNKELVWYAEDALCEWEKELRLPSGNNCPHILSVFSRENHLTSVKRSRGGTLLSRHFSYSDCFNAIFVIMGLSGLVVAIVLLFAPPAISSSSKGDGVMIIDHGSR